MINKIILKLLLMMCITCLEYTLIYSRFVHMTVKVCSFLSTIYIYAAQCSYEEKGWGRVMFLGLYSQKAPDLDPECHGSTG